MNSEPSSNGHSGRQGNGKFAPGNKLGRGNPFNKRACELRAAMMGAVEPDDVRKAVESLVKKARGGDVVAIRELFDRLFGKPAPHDLTARVEALEQHLEREQ